MLVGKVCLDHNLVRYIVLHEYVIKYQFAALLQFMIFLVAEMVKVTVTLLWATNDVCHLFHICLSYVVQVIICIENFLKAYFCLIDVIFEIIWC